MTVDSPEPLKLTVEQFLAFYNTRPDEEQWQLIDGAAILTPPPLIMHQHIAGNLQELLHDPLEMNAPHLWAGQRIGIELLPEFPHYRPEPDIAVIEVDFPQDRRHVDRFYLAAEILSQGYDERIELKLPFIAPMNIIGRSCS
jgi:Uma2 family endonuclease